MRKKTLLILTKTTILTLALSILVGCSHQQETNSVTTTPAPTTTLHTHSYTETITTEAVCETDGVKTFTCTCGDTYTEAIAKLGHNYDAVVTATTCTEAGFTTHTCANCGGSYTDSEVTATGHNYEAVADSAKKATCSKDDKEADTKCSYCGNIVEGAVISAKGHNYSEYVYNNDATTEKDGTETATCSACGKKKTRTAAGTKLAPETLWSDGYAKHV